ncbi:DUF309 domain-containing protein [Paenactinomyces guangxiensis]|uniref:DUF309 domain-containing protein n=1 Tax=Paenactinomyces guangxiensis TaxID=1490290 RepID=A0A7W2A765_9BACL|nr:DUF309 domain-containing protein [Paenactinomyces guangxiensis]MBA4492812.1 DUF309 domain-containing protein [Paenactinomyces guangxiensis]MBH8590339.1 DUF309 domain-containing protein [Paenactinomyces guangxiensis]
MNQTYHPLYLEFFRCYHRGEYWEAHEVLEELWQTQRENDFYHGLIQIAAIMHQLRRGKVRGARKLATTAIGYLQPYSPQKEGVQVDRVLDWLHKCLHILPDGIAKMEPSELEKLGIETCELPDFDKTATR